MLLKTIQYQILILWPGQQSSQYVVENKAPTHPVSLIRSGFVLLVFNKLTIWQNLLRFSPPDSIWHQSIPVLQSARIMRLPRNGYQRVQ